MLLAAAKGTLDQVDQLNWSPKTAVAVVLASENYPDAPATGRRIRGLKKAAKVDGAHVLHAGTALRDGKVVSAGGRVLAVVGLGDSLEDARSTAYESLELIELEGGQYRTDIALKASRSESRSPGPRRLRHERLRPRPPRTAGLAARLLRQGPGPVRTGGRARRRRPRGRE